MRTRLVRLGVFSPSVLLGVAAADGTLDRAGLRVEELPVASSPHQFTLLLAGELDAVLTSPDNVLAYRGSAANPLGRTVDVRILAAVDRGLGLSLFSAAGTEPRGGVLAVDVPTSGFAFVAYELLARQGLRRGLDYEVRAMGSTPLRADALMAGRCATTVLNAGSDLRAEAAGCVRLSRAVSLGSYVGTVLAALGSALDNDDDNDNDDNDDDNGGPATLRVLTKAVLGTARSIVADDAARATAISVAEDRLGLDGERAARYVATLADPQEGLIPDGRLDPASLSTLRWLRSRYGGTGSEHGALTAADSGLLDERGLD